MNRNTYLVIALFSFLFGATLNGCYYDNEAYLYANENACDNSVITYTGRIKAICDANCATSGCHAGASPSDGLNLEGYDNVVAGTQNTSIICSIQGQSGCSSMPKNSPLMSQCDIDAWLAWQAANYPN